MDISGIFLSPDPAPAPAHRPRPNEGRLLQGHYHPMQRIFPTVRLLRLGNSYDTDPNVAPGANKVSVADRILAEGSGEQIETTIRVVWPSPALPGLIDGWLDRYQPDVAILVVSSYWFTYVSVPVRVERSFGPLGKPLARAGLKAAATPWLAHNPAFRLARRATLSTIGGATNFTPAEVIESMETCIRRILTRETVALVVRGPRVAFAADGTEKSRQWAEKRRAAVSTHMAEFCRRLHVEYVAYDVGASPLDSPNEFQGDLVHATAGSHEDQGRLEGDALLRAWRARMQPHAGQTPE